METTLDRTADADQPALPASVVASSRELWAAQDLWTDLETGFDLPTDHRAGHPGAKPLPIVLMDTSPPAYSSPISTVNLGHAIRVRPSHLPRTLIHEFFHTFEWNAIDVRDIGGSSTGRTISFYESAANWGVHRFSVAGNRQWGYDADRVATEWLNTPQAAFLQRSGLTPMAPESYAYFPALEWLDQNAGPAGDVPSGSRGIIEAALLGYRGHDFGADPVDLLEDQLHDRWIAFGEEDFSRVWPRMWTALYLMTGGEEEAASDSADHRWAYFWDSEVEEWREELANPPATEEDAFGGPRPARVTPVVPLDEPNVYDWIDDVVVGPGGAAFADYELPAGHEGEVRFEVHPGDGFDPGKYEAAVILFDGTHPNVCEDEVGVPQIVLSDGERSLDGSIVLDVPFSPECRRATLVLAHTDPNSGAFAGLFSIGAAIKSMQVPEPPPVPDDEVIPPGEPWPWHEGSVASSFTSADAPLLCYTNETIFSSYASPGGTRYAGIWVPAGQSVTFDVSGEILPSRYVGSGRGEYEYSVRVVTGGQVLFDQYTVDGVGIVSGGGPYPWQPPFGPERIGTWHNTTGTNQVFLIETEADPTYAGAATRWNIHVTGGDGSGAPGCAG